MGYLTTITFRNDAYSSFEKNKKELANGILSAINGFGDFSVGPESNPVIVQRSRHMDDQVLYLHSGNTVIDIDDIHTGRDNHEWAIDIAIKEMEYQLNRLKNLR